MQHQENRSFRRLRQCPPLVTALLTLVAVALKTTAQPSPRLLLAFSSYRDRPRHAQAYFYEHDGVGEGKLVGGIEAVSERQDTHPSLAAGVCAVALEQENQPGRIGLWDLTAKKLIDLSMLNDSPNALMSPSISADGKLLAFAAWNKPGASARWDLFLFDLTAKKFVELPGLNTQSHDERMPALSGDGNWLAFVTNKPGGAGGNDVWLLDRSSNQIQALRELNSPRSEVDPSLSREGGLVAFSSDRPGGLGGRDVYAFDRKVHKLLPLPGLNSVAHEQSPSLTSDGRFIAFVSERIAGAGERDIYLYDRQAQKLLPTPGLNSKAEDFDPSVVLLP